MITVTLLLVVVLFSGGVLEEVVLQFFVEQDTIVKGFFFVHSLQVAVRRQFVAGLALEGVDSRSEGRLRLALELLLQLVVLSPR